MFCGVKLGKNKFLSNYNLFYERCQKIYCVNRPQTEEDVNYVLLRCLAYGAKSEPKGYYLPSYFLMHIVQGLPPSSWQAIYSHESAHAMLNYNWLGWTIQALDDLANNLFIAVKNELDNQNKLISWMLNIEYKKRKLCQTWLETQEGLALFYQLELLNLEKQTIKLAQEMGKLTGHSLTKKEVNALKAESRKINNEIRYLISSKKCKPAYWKGYHKIFQIYNIFGKEFLAPAIFAACFVRLPPNFIEKTPQEFDAFLRNWHYNADRRLEAILRISPTKIPSKAKKDSLSLMKFLLNHFDQKLDDERLYVYLNKLFTHDSLPVTFKEKFVFEYNLQKTEAELRWKKLEQKGQDPLQVFSLLNDAGEMLPITIPDLKSVISSETKEIMQILFKKLFVGYEKCLFFQELLNNMRSGSLENWMSQVAGCSEINRIIKLFPETKLTSQGRKCPICLEYIHFKNYLLTCPLSGINICMDCCKNVCFTRKCENFSYLENKIANLNKIIKEFKYCL